MSLLISTNKIIFLLLFLFISNTSFNIHYSNTEKKSCCYKKELGKCTGSINCSACSTCELCKYCVNGRTCGKCNFVKAKVYNTTKSERQKIQCEAITKKGTQCSRNAVSNNLCTQHLKMN